jgi:site-specific recombinase XerC
MFKQLIEFTVEHGVKFADELDLKVLTEFRAGWKIGPLTASKRLERLRSLYKFAMRRKMLEENFALSLAAPKVKQNPTLPFSKDEMAKILKAAESDKVDKRVKTFMLTMRYAGLRISDVATLAVDSLKGKRLKLYQDKTVEPVSVLLPQHAADALHSVERTNPKYFFWNGTSKTGNSNRNLARAYCCCAHPCESRRTPAPIPGYVRGRVAGRRSEHRDGQRFTRPSEHQSDRKALQPVG